MKFLAVGRSMNPVLYDILEDWCIRRKLKKALLRRKIYKYTAAVAISMILSALIIFAI